MLQSQPVGSSMVLVDKENKPTTIVERSPVEIIANIMGIKDVGKLTKLR